MVKRYNINSRINEFNFIVFFNEFFYRLKRFNYKLRNKELIYSIINSFKN